MDPLRADDLARARATPPDEKLRQALELMRVGFALKRVNLRQRFPHATDEQLEAHFLRWCCREE